MLEVLPPRKVVLSVSGSLDESGVALARIQDLHSRGHWIAMNFHELDESQLRAVLPFLKTLMIDFSQSVAQRTVDSLLGLRGRITIMARGVTTDSRYKELARSGIDLFQGYYFAPETKVDTRSAPNPAKAQLLRLLTLILEDADNTDLVDEIKRNPTLSYNLLRLVNSAASGNLRTISSVQQAIVLMGRRQLQRWLNLMLFAGNNASDQNPLLQVAATRARLMELMVEARPQSTQDERDQAFVTGVLSLVHVLLNSTPEAALEAIPLSPEVRAALMSREGRLGNLLALAESLESEDAARTQSLWALVSYVPMKRMLDLQLEAYRWARALESSATKE
jgi:EAL and modified HD-GYP domain-containing signal transduction protein